MHIPYFPNVSETFLVGYFGVILIGNKTVIGGLSEFQKSDSPWYVCTILRTMVRGLSEFQKFRQPPAYVLSDQIGIVPTTKVCLFVC